MIAYYHDLLQDAIRIEAYKKAIGEVVRKDDIVVEIGTGIGTYALFAARAGAKKVFAIEKSPIIHLASEIARDNGLAERIEFIAAHSTSTSLPDKADVLIFEEFESFFFTHMLCRVMARARAQLLKPGAKVIPITVSLFLAPINSPKLHESISFTGRGRSDEDFGINFAKANVMAMNNHYVKEIASSSLLAPGQRVQQMNLMEQPDDSFVSRSKYVSKGGMIHGLAGWFELGLSDSVTLATAPDQPQTCWSQSYFPIEVPIPTNEGESIDVTFKHLRAKGGLHSWFAWAVSAGTAACQGSTFQGAPFSLDELRKKDRKHVPSLGENQKIRYAILQSINGERSIEAIASMVIAEFPREFQSVEEACARISHEIEQ